MKIPRFQFNGWLVLNLLVVIGLLVVLIRAIWTVYSWIFMVQ